MKLCSNPDELFYKEPVSVNITSKVCDGVRSRFPAFLLNTTLFISVKSSGWCCLCWSLILQCCWNTALLSPTSSSASWRSPPPLLPTASAACPFPWSAPLLGSTLWMTSWTVSAPLWVFISLSSCLLVVCFHSWTLKLLLFSLILIFTLFPWRCLCSLDVCMKPNKLLVCLFRLCQVWIWFHSLLDHNSFI